MKTIWQEWTKITKIFAKRVANVVLLIIFIILIIPVSIFLKLFFKHALLGHTASVQKNTYWKKRQKIKQDLLFAKHQ